jgi:hypothetical protein
MPHQPPGRGRPGRPAWSTGGIRTVRGRTRRGRVPAPWTASWVRCGRVGWNRGATPPTTEPSGRCGLRSSGASACQAPITRRAIAGWSGSSRGGRRVACGASARSRSWWTRSRAPSTANLQMSPGSNNAAPPEQLHVNRSSCCPMGFTTLRTSWTLKRAVRQRDRYG